MEDQDLKWKKRRYIKIREYIIISYIISILLIGLLVLKMFITISFGVLSYDLMMLPPFFTILYIISKFVSKSRVQEQPSTKSYFLFTSFVIIITLLLFYSINLNSITDNKHFFKIYYFIPLILYTVNYGQGFGFFGAIFSSLNLLALNYLLKDFSCLDLDFIIIIIFFWVIWLIGGYTDLERRIQKHLETLTTKLKKTNQSLRESQELFRLNFDKAHIGMIIGDIEGNIIKANKAICNMLEYSEEEFKGMNFKEVVHPDDLESALSVYKKLIAGKIITANGEIRFMNRDGSVVWVKNNITIVKDVEGRPLYLLSQIENITRKKMVEAEIKKQKEMLEYNRLKTRFFAKLSHELKTPLNLIFTALQIINTNKDKYLKEEGNKKFSKYMYLIKQNSYRLLRLVNNIIDLTKIDTDSFNLNIEEHNIILLVKKITLSTEEYIINHKRVLEFNSDTEEKIIACDPFCIERIILNLISNAVKFTDEGDKISVNVYDKDMNVLISVRDTGIGIKKDKLNLIFEQFRQVDESFSRRSEGSGIGLSIVKSLVELHGGRVWVESEFGQGSEFFVELPVKNINGKAIKRNYLSDNLIDRINIEFSDIYDL